MAHYSHFSKLSWDTTENAFTSLLCIYSRTLTANLTLLHPCWAVYDVVVYYVEGNMFNRKRIKITDDDRTAAAAMLLEYRTQRGITQTALAKEFSCERSALSKVENADKRAPTSTVAIVLARCAGPPLVTKRDMEVEAHNTSPK